MGELIEEMTKAGVLLDTAGLTPIAQCVRVHCRGGETSVTDGPFTEAKEVVGGYAPMQCKDRAEAIEWTKRFLKVHEPHWTVTCEAREVVEGQTCLAPASQGCRIGGCDTTAHRRPPRCRRDRLPHRVPEDRRRRRPDRPRRRHRRGTGPALLAARAPSPVVELNRAVAVSMAEGPAPPWRSSTPSRVNPPCATTTCSRAAEATCCAASAARRRRARSSSGPPRWPATSASGSCCCAGLRSAVRPGVRPASSAPRPPGSGTPSPSSAPAA